MSPWDGYPEDYRETEVARLVGATAAGECAAVVGLSGAGKSNLLGFLAHRVSSPNVEFVLVDGNRLRGGADDLLRLIRRALGDRDGADDEIEALEGAIAARLEASGRGLSILLDRFDEPAEDRALLDNLRALRDSFKYRLTLVPATRRPIPADNELAELLSGATIWLGPMREADSRWNVARYAARRGETWDEPTTRALVQHSGGYPSMLRAACEAVSAGAAPTLEALAAHPAVRARVEEFWADAPPRGFVERAGLSTNPLLHAGRAPRLELDPATLTAKEQALLDTLMAAGGEIVDKDDLIRGVWPEDRIYEEGVRDASLAQLVRRLRRKIEPDPSSPTFIQTVPGRGYRFRDG